MPPTFIVAMDATALLLALPRLSADLGATGVQQPWISDGYGFLVAGMVIAMGTLGDRIGQRRLLMTGAGRSAAGSLLLVAVDDGRALPLAMTGITVLAVLALTAHPTTPSPLPTRQAVS